MNKKLFGIMIFVFGLSLTSACSKNLMPPEGQASGSIAGSEMSEAASAGIDSGSFGESGSGFFNEGDVGESGSSGDFMTNGPGGSGSTGTGQVADSGSGSGTPGDGYSGHFESDPFSGGSSDSGIEEARLQTFSATSDLRDIHFEFDRYDLDDKSRAVLRKNADYLKANPTAKIEIQGHCDERGTNNYNIALGERRAQSTKMYLVSQGVSGSRIHTISYGEEKPFCSDSNARCWLENRRAHFMMGR